MVTAHSLQDGPQRSPHILPVRSAWHNFAFRLGAFFQNFLGGLEFLRLKQTWRNLMKNRRASSLKNDALVHYVAYFYQVIWSIVIFIQPWVPECGQQTRQYCINVVSGMAVSGMKWISLDFVPGLWPNEVLGTGLKAFLLLLNVKKKELRYKESLSWRLCVCTSKFLYKMLRSWVKLYIV